MRTLALAILTLAMAPAAVAGQPVELRGIAVSARRPDQTGRVTTTIDSTALHDNPAQSLAEILGFNSSLFIKNYGRATAATASFRGTSPSHTQVTWNGMRIGSPMLGTTDFSTIPGFFIDRARLEHGSSSLVETGGGIGGLVSLSSDAPADNAGKPFTAQFMQGVGQWGTLDEFLRLGFSRRRLSASVRVNYSSSDNDFPYTNYDKKENIYDDNHQIISSYYPRERNRSGAWRDFHALGSVAYDGGAAGRFSLNIWGLSSNRELPLLTTDYADERLVDNRQREQTVRAVAGWHKSAKASTFRAAAGYIHSWLAYDYARQLGNGVNSVMSRARSHINSAYASAGWSWGGDPHWHLSANVDYYHHSASSCDFAVVSPGSEPPAYDCGRHEFSVSVAPRWRPVQRLGLGSVVRWEVVGRKAATPCPALFAEYTLVPSLGLMAKLSGSRNYRFPSLNDLYTIPGGNPDLRPERGWAYDAGLSADFSRGIATFGASAGWFDSQISDWIQWLPSPKGFYVPSNVRRVHAYGIESSASAALRLPGGWDLSLSGSYTWSASVNRGRPASEADASVGRQLPYIPRHSASGSIRLGWRQWGLTYKIHGYSERFTMSSNESTLTGRLPAYSVSNLSVERGWDALHLKWLAKTAINNLLNAEYQAVLSRPMPGINFEFFLSITY